MGNTDISCPQTGKERANRNNIANNFVLIAWT